MEKIYVLQEKIVKFEDDSYKAIAKIRKMYTNIIKKKFLLVKISIKCRDHKIYDYVI